VEKFDNKNEASRNLKRMKDFLKNVKNIKCEWGSLKDSILLKMRVYGFSYSVKTATPNLIEYNYKDNFNNILKGVIKL